MEMVSDCGLWVGFELDCFCGNGGNWIGFLLKCYVL